MDKLNPQPNPNYIQQHTYNQHQQTETPHRHGEPPLHSGYRIEPAVPLMGYSQSPEHNEGTYVIGSNDRSPPMETPLMDDYDVDIKFFDFSNKSIQRNFIRKVYAILSCQLLLTLAVIAVFIFCEPVKLFVVRTPKILYLAGGVYVAMAIVLLCITEIRRKVPLNYIMLFIFTAATSIMLGAISATANISEVMIAVGVTAIICFTVTLFAFQTKYDFTMCKGFILCALLALLIAILAYKFYPTHLLGAVCASLGIFIFSFSLVYHTQLMIGGKHRYSITPEEYAALTLYLDTINIFVLVLRIYSWMCLNGCVSSLLKF